MSIRSYMKIVEGVSDVPSVEWPKNLGFTFASLLYRVFNDRVKNGELKIKNIEMGKSGRLMIHVVGNDFDEQFSFLPDNKNMQLYNIRLGDE
jgi:hypothetical protein